jgi:plastocyanin
MNKRDLKSIGKEIKNVENDQEQWQMRPQEKEVLIDFFSFMPQDITVAPGATVTWVNRDDVQHAVASTDKTFKSKVLCTDDKFSFKFNEPGAYEYHCSIHPKMRGKVIVQ